MRGVTLVVVVLALHMPRGRKPTDNTSPQPAGWRRTDELSRSGKRRVVVNEDGLKAKRRVTPEGGFSVAEAKKSRASVAGQKRNQTVAAHNAEERMRAQRTLPFLQEQPTVADDSVGTGRPGSSIDRASAS